MTGQQLKNSILQLAIQGKLVPQDPNDEPASELLKRIRKEKEQLVKDGKLKKKDLESEPITDEEKPFDIPESWEWCRLGELMFPPKYGTASKSSSKGEMIVLRMGNIQNGKVVYDKLVYSNNKEDNEKYLLQPYDLLFNRTNSAELVGKTALYLGDRPCIYAGYLILLRPIISTCAEFINYVLASKYSRDYCKDVKTIGVQQCNINAEKIAQHIIPLPPLSEQQRIVAKIEELMPLVEEYGKSQDALNKLNAELPEQLKKSILQQAIMGKLGTQDPTDEPASVLLSKIRAEKEQLVKAGKLKKKDLETTPIEDDEKPFDIPDSWEWVKLQDICYLVDGEKNLEKGILLDAKYLRGKSEPEYISGGKFVRKGDNIILVDGENSGEVFEAPIDGVMGSTFKQIVINTAVNKKYVLVQILYYKSLLRNSKKGAAIPHLNKDVFRNLCIPLPPLAEQHRIVEKLEQILPALNGIVPNDK